MGYFSARAWRRAAVIFGLLAAGASAQAQTASVESVTVSSERLRLLGTALTSSQGVVVNDELALTPAYRTGQLLETVPGLVVTTHSGEGKANQYLLRGFSLDHGTDLSINVDGMPINERSHAHGQGYADLNFMIPELATGIHFTKGSYFAQKGDFSSVGSVDIGYLDHIDDQARVTAGTLGFQRLFTAASREVGAGNLLGALELQHYDGPWVHPDDQRKLNAVLRYAAGDAEQGYSLTAMYYGGLWNASTDQPERALQAGLITRFDTLDPSDGGSAQRISLSGQVHAAIGAGEVHANLYAVNNRLTLWNDFTHFLDNPVDGDQEAQHESRLTLGGTLGYSRSDNLLGLDNELLAGIDARYDDNHVGREFTQARRFLGIAEDDRVRESSVGFYLQATTHWADWFRSVIGLREDVFSARDAGTNAGQASQDMLQPKASLIFTLSPGTELYASAGRGFHSDDVRGVTQASTLGISGAPLLARSTGAEIGVREEFMPTLSATLTLFQTDFQSELTYDPDAGATGAGPASRRMGIELNTTWQALDWLEFYATVAASHARYAEESDDGAGGHLGRHIPNAPSVIGSLHAYMKNLGRWGGGLEFRYLGAFPLTPDNTIQGSGYGEWNGEVSYTLDSGWKFEGGLYNILDTHADAERYYYTDRLRGEPPQGAGDVHFHPLEPRSVRLTLARSF